MARDKKREAHRRAVASRSATVRRSAEPPSDRDPLDRLHAAVVAIGDAFGTDADCASAAALLREAARIMGYTLVPRPVSAVILDHKSGNTLIMGPKARARFAPGALEKLENHLPDGKDNGHIVLTSEDPRALYDSNLRQTGAYGVEAPSIVMNIRSTEPESGEWVFKYGDLEVLYIVDDETRVLVEAMERVAPKLAESASILVDNLRAGVSIEELRAQSECSRAQRSR